MSEASVLNAVFQSNGKQKNITYHVPLEEIAERIEYEYAYENTTDHIADQDYNQLSFLPSGEDIAISIYTVEGNKILFLPEEKTNKETIVNGEPCMLRQNGRSGEYEVNIGEYEAPFRNRVCLSAAVTGEKDGYYFRYLIVKSGKGNYYF